MRKVIKKELLKIPTIEELKIPKPCSIKEVKERILEVLEDDRNYTCKIRRCGKWKGPLKSIIIL